MTETNHSSFKSGSYFGTDPKQSVECIFGRSECSRRRRR
jgi:hypothetical protein